MINAVYIEQTEDYDQIIHLYTLFIQYKNV